MKDIELQLKELILDDDFTNLWNLANEEINLMDILKVSHKELQHSNFLAWLFNPSESHNLWDSAFKDFIKLYFKENQFQNLWNQSWLSVFDFVELKFDDLEIKREYKNIDLIFLSEKNGFCLIIENKIYSTERKWQLEKYRNFIENEYPDFKHKIYIYLSLEEQEINEDAQKYYVQLNYNHIIKLIEIILWNQKLKIGDKTKFVFEQYLQTLNSMLNKNQEIEKIAQEMYKKYKWAFDLVFKYAVPNDNELFEIIRNLIENETTLVPFKSSKTYLRFQPAFLYENRMSLEKYWLISKEDDLKDNWMFLFEFHIWNNWINFDFKIWVGEKHSREKLFNILKENNDVFSKIKEDNLLKPQWHLAFQKRFLSDSEIQKYYENNDNEIQVLIEKRFFDLVHNDIPTLMDRIKLSLI